MTFISIGATDMQYLRPLPQNEVEAAELIRAERNARLAASDWIVLRNLETNEPIPQEWLDYRQALRDLPMTANPKWPEEPK